MTLPIALLAAVAMLGLPAGSDAAQAPKGFFGVHPRSLASDDYPTMAGADVGLIRTGFVYSAVRPSESAAYDWSRYDAVVAGAAEQGIDVLPVLVGVPPWLSTEAGATPLDSSAAKAAWRDFLTAAVERYGPGGTFWDTYPGTPHPIEDWQAWNEPNSFNNWKRPNPRQYGKLLALSAKTIHAADPSANVISAGVISQPVNRKAMDGDVYLKKMLKSRKAARAADAIAIHPYTGKVRQVREQIELTRKVMDRAKLKRTPIWVTEIGWGQGRGGRNPLIVPAAEQRRNLRESFRMALEKRRKLRIARVVWYQWRDGLDEVCGWCNTSGLLREDGSAKPLLDEFAAIARR
ncbi:MAG: hypothetical protein BroJett022_06950 [Actinomycetes bacterium]|nr:MAG: hypothetical protein BroJett022_06950 [Actinomycetes bacterium]